MIILNDTLINLSNINYVDYIECEEDNTYCLTLFFDNKDYCDISYDSFKDLQNDLYFILRSFNKINNYSL